MGQQARRGGGSKGKPGLGDPSRPHTWGMSGQHLMRTTTEDGHLLEVTPSAPSVFLLCWSPTYCPSTQAMTDGSLPKSHASLPCLHSASRAAHTATGGRQAQQAGKQVQSSQAALDQDLSSAGKSATALVRSRGTAGKHRLRAPEDTNSQRLHGDRTCSYRYRRQSGWRSSRELGDTASQQSGKGNKDPAAQGGTRLARSQGFSPSTTVCTVGNR